MDKILIKGGKPLFGSIKISGAKNSALPIMAASLLTSETLILSNIPHLSDVSTMCKVLSNHGVEINIIGEESSYRNNHRVISLNASKITNYDAPYELVSQMRASFLVLGPLLARFGKAKVSMPGGCLIGTRPINLHLKALEEMGATIELKNGYIEAIAKKGLKGADINFEIVSVGATENIMMAATLANGITTISNAAIEPEITDLANLLIAMGAKIEGVSTNYIRIIGVNELLGASHSVIPDRIEAATYAIASLITGGEINLEGINYNIFSNIADKLTTIGGKVIPDLSNNSVRIKSSSKLKPIFVETGPYPSFPTDVQAQIMSLLSLASGISFIKENLYENRYMHILELNRMGADIKVEGNLATVNGVKKLYGAEVMATDLRASSSLVLAGLAASGDTVINRVYHLDRGYERLENKLAMCGAEIKRVI